MSIVGDVVILIARRTQDGRVVDRYSGCQYAAALVRKEWLSQYPVPLFAIDEAELRRRGDAG